MSAVSVSTAQMRADIATAQAAADAAGLGVGQTWQNMTASRASGVTYTNSTGKSIVVIITRANSALNGSMTIFINGGALARPMEYPGGGGSATTIIVPHASTYRVDFFNSSAIYWQELR